MKLFRFGHLSLLAGLLCACSSSQQQSGVSALKSIEVLPAFPHLTFTQPLALVSADDSSNRLFVVEQPGVVLVFPNDSAANRVDTFLNITGRVDDSGWEEGLLGLAFHPDYQSNGFFFVDYTAANPDRSVVSRFKVSKDDPDKADPASEVVLLEFTQPYSNHNGGCLQFGPDKYLYIAVGDGGAANDPRGNGQDRSSLLGSILRLDVDHISDGKRYAIPPDNPFADNDSGWREEIFAYGLRNPWRFSFDAVTGKLWAGDVGQDRIEEVDIVTAGGNFGWNIMEGRECLMTASESGCDTAGLILPVTQYYHPEGASITGGYVYRGSSVPNLVGKYVFADFMTGKLWLLEQANSVWTISTPLDIGLAVSSFGIDEKGELYLCAFDGRIYRIAARE